MSVEQEFPPGWDLAKIKGVIAHYDDSSDDALAAEDDCAAEAQADETVIRVPTALLPAIRQLIATYKPA